MLAQNINGIKTLGIYFLKISLMLISLDLSKSSVPEHMKKRGTADATTDL